MTQADLPPSAPAFQDVAVVVNRKAGAVRRLGAEAVIAAYRDALGDRLIGIYAGGGGEMADLVRKAVDEGAKIVLPIGGDGTCTAIAELARDGGFTASALPGGTKNILARRLWGEDADLLAIAETLKRGEVELRRMDAGEANGRLFFVGASFGMVPHLARARERLRGRAEPSGVWAAFRHIMRLGRRGILRPRIAYTVPGGDSARCAGLMVSVKSIDEMLFRAGEKPDPASFDCAAANPRGWLQLVWLGLRAVFTDTWRNQDTVRDFNVPHLDVDGRNPLIVALDGEAVALEAPVKLTLLQDAIPLIGRARDADEAADKERAAP